MGTATGRELWPSLVLLAAAVLTPTVCVLWLMGQAVRNERLAVRQRLVDVYRGQLTTSAAKLDAYWDTVLATPELSTAEPGEWFAAVVLERQICDSVVVLDVSGRVRYPPPAREASPSAGLDARWRRAEALEFEQGDFAGAARAYAAVAEQSDDLRMQTHGWLSQARCLVKAGDAPGAVAVLSGPLAGEAVVAAPEDEVRRTAANAALRLLQLSGDSGSTLSQDARVRLLGLLHDYGPHALPSGQRRFLLDELSQLVVDEDLARWLAAEELAADYVSAGAAIPEGEGWTETAMFGVWGAAAPVADDVVLVFLSTEAHLREASEAVVAGALGEHARVALARKGEPGDRPETPVVRIQAGRYLRDWDLVAHLVGPNPFEEAAARQVALYVWTGVLVLALFFLLALVVAYRIVRQLRLTRLKNELIATVSHELKTPLASMRVLVDTLRGGRCADKEQERQYMALLAKENARLSRLIDNFLTFSRMERNKRAFERDPVDLGAVAREAVDTVRERFEASGGQLGLEIAEGVWEVRGDRDALVTAVVNLLDNAYIYGSTDRDRRVVVRVCRGVRCLVVEVRDNGIGIPPRALRKVFGRFYQVDQSLSREVGGCGLGLSIVQFIVRAHGGQVHAASELGRGSTFTIELPAEPNGELPR